VPSRCSATVERRARIERDGHAQVRRASALPAEPLLARALADMGVWRRGVDLEEPLEGLPRPVVLGGVEAGSPEGLEDRALVRLGARRAFQDDRGLGMVPVTDERLAALEQLVGALAIVVVRELLFHRPMVPRIGSIGPAGERLAATGGGRLRPAGRRVPERLRTLDAPAKGRCRSPKLMCAARSTSGEERVGSSGRQPIAAKIVCP
jgi:hypothetical protein